MNKKSGVHYDGYGNPVLEAHTVHTLELPKHDFMTKSRRAHARQATRILREDIKKGLVDKSKFTEKQLADIQAGKANIDDLTWDHVSGTSRRMDLVLRGKHKETAHTGNYALMKKKEKK